jgi:hemolysin D
MATASLRLPFPSRSHSEREFLPAALEIIETPASPAGRSIAGAIIAFFVLALTWAVLGWVDIVATAPGKIVPTGRSKVIQPLDSGIVHAIHVQNGQMVKAGDLLIELDPTESAADRNRLAGELLAARLEAARLEAMLSGAPDPSATSSHLRAPTRHRSHSAASSLAAQWPSSRPSLPGLTSRLPSTKPIASRSPRRSRS